MSPASTSFPERLIPIDSPTFTIVSGIAGVKVGGLFATTIISKFRVPVAPCSSVAVSVIVVVPATVGVPEKVPVAGLKVTPVGGADEERTMLSKSLKALSGTVKDQGALV